MKPTEYNAKSEMAEKVSNLRFSNLRWRYFTDDDIDAVLRVLESEGYELEKQKEFDACSHVHLIRDKIPYYCSHCGDDIDNDS